jgi:tetratricopeptide (TPR) repeat protein
VSELAQISRELAIRSAAMDQPPTTRPAPVEVKSLATGVNVSVVAAMLNKAEALMRSGKYASALDQYAAAEAASPSNPLVWLGRAHGELGAGYYNRAELHLRQALTADPTLLMGRYDLRQMMGEERITYLVGDLKQLAMQDARSATPLILLSYIAYNVGRENEAGLWLKTASERLPKADLLVRILREHWRVSP